MKFLLGMVVVGLGIIGLTYSAGGIAGYDPTAQGEEAMEAIQPGMTWERVIETTQPPGKYRSMIASTTPDGFESVTPAGSQRFDLDSFRKHAAADGYTHGFIFEYRYSAEAAFDVWFDEAGEVASVQMQRGVADLLHMR